MSSDLGLILPLEASKSNREIFASRGTNSQAENAFGSFDDRVTMTQSKTLAFECNKKSPLDTETHNAQVLLDPKSEISPKRKFDQYKNNGRRTSTFDLVYNEKYGNENEKICRSRSSLSFSPRGERRDTSQGTQEPVTFPALDDKVECCRICTEDYSHLSDSDDTFKGQICTKNYSHLTDSNEYINVQSCMEDYSHLSDSGDSFKEQICTIDYSHLDDSNSSIEGQSCMENYSLLSDSDDSIKGKICMEDYSHMNDSNDSIKTRNSMNQRSMKRQPKDIIATSSIDTSSTKMSISKKPKMKFVKVLKLVNEDVVNNNKTSLSSKEEDMELIHPHMKFLPSRGSHLPRPVIPIGPRFQAEVPKWEGTTYVKHHSNYHSSYDDLKWLGTQIWPMPIKSKTNIKSIGEGRPDSCSCDFRGSVDCVQQHIREARKLLRVEIGSAFSTWKFDEMGEYFSKSWTLEEQREFESLVKSNPLSNDTNDTNFWELAMEHFPSKSLKCMVNYYFNVYIPRRMSMDTRSSFEATSRKPIEDLQD